MEKLQAAIDDLNPEKLEAERMKAAVAARIAEKAKPKEADDLEAVAAKRGKLAAHIKPAHANDGLAERIEELRAAAGGALNIMDIIRLARAAASATVYTWGGTMHGEGGEGFRHADARPSPSRLGLLSESRTPRVVAAGKHFCAAVTEKGELFMWGQNAASQLCVGERGSLQGVYRPFLQRSLSKLMVKHVACGTTHALACVASGDVWVWGSAGAGQLGVGPPSDDEILLAQNRVFEDTSEQFYQELGLDTPPEEPEAGFVIQTRTEPVRLAEFGTGTDAGAAVRVFASGWMSGALTSEGVAYTWGCGITGGLGQGLDVMSAPVTSPAQVQLGRHVVRTMALGDTFSAYVVDKGTLLVVGALGISPVRFVSKRMDRAWLVSNCDLPSPRTEFGDRPVVLNVGAHRGVLTVVTNATPAREPPLPGYEPMHPGRYVHTEWCNAENSVRSALKPDVPMDSHLSGVVSSSLSTLSRAAGVTLDHPDAVHKVYVAGRGYLGLPPRISGVSYPVVDGTAQTGEQEDGATFWCDYDQHTRLYYGFQETEELQPITALDAEPIVSVEPGGTLMVARTRDGRLFTWGLNLAGQCGMEQPLQSQQLPLIPPLLHLPGKHYADVAVGHEHVLGVVMDGVSGSAKTAHLARKYGDMWLRNVFGNDGPPSRATYRRELARLAGAGVTFDAEFTSAMNELVDVENEDVRELMQDPELARLMKAVAGAAKSSAGGEGAAAPEAGAVPDDEEGAGADAIAALDGLDGDDAAALAAALSSFGAMDAGYDSS